MVLRLDKTNTTKIEYWSLRFHFVSIKKANRKQYQNKQTWLKKTTTT